MIINTKYKVGDTFWKLHNNSVEEFIVDNIRVNVRVCCRGTISEFNDITITYVSTSGDIKSEVTENAFYPTKAALLASL